MDLEVRKYVKWQGNLAYINSFTHVIQKGLVDIETEVKTGCVECVFTWPPSLHLWTNKHELWQKKLYLIVTWIALIDCHLTNYRLSGWRSVNALASHMPTPGIEPGSQRWDGHVVTKSDRNMNIRTQTLVPTGMINISCITCFVIGVK